MNRTTLLFILGLVTLTGGWLSLSHDRHIAALRVTELMVADQTANPTAAQLASLHSYVSDHMGTTAAFVLTGSYTRAQQAAAIAAAAALPNGDVYHQAQAACASIKNAVSQAQCNEQYLATHLQAPSSTPAVTAPVLASYTYAWKAPLWTPNSAGWLLAAGTLLLLSGAYRLLWHRRY